MGRVRTPRVPMPGRLLWLGLILSLTLFGCTPSVGSTGIEVTATPVVSASPTPHPVALLRAGDCTGAVDLSGGSITNLVAVPCRTPHFYEVHAAFAITGETYPGAGTLADRATAACAPSFLNYVGVEPSYGRYSSAYLVPDAAAWTLPDNRWITCLVGSPEGGLVGSAKGDFLLFPKPGQCTGPQNVPALEVRIIDCSLSHSYEVFADKLVKSKDPLSRTGLDKLFTDVCHAGFKKFIGVDEGRSKYELSYFIAGKDVWKKVADHRIVCSAGSPAGGIKGKLAGVRK